MQICYISNTNFGKIIADKSIKKAICDEYAETKMSDDVRKYIEYKFTKADASKTYDIFVNSDGTAIVKSKSKPYKVVSEHCFKTPLQSLYSAVKSITK